MYKTRIGLAAAVVATAVIGATNDVTADVTHVTVHPNTAVVTRTVNATEGDSVRLHNLTHRLQPDSVRVETLNESVHIGRLDVTSRTKRDVDDERVAKLEQRLDAAQAEKRQVIDKLENLKQRLRFLSETGAALTTAIQNGKSSSNWTKNADELAERRRKILEDRTRQTERKKTLNEQIADLKDQLVDARRGTSEKRYEVVIHLARAIDEPVALNVTYQVTNVGWTPVYDARLDTEAREVTLARHAKVTQSTGRDWTDVEMTLATTAPARGTQAPDLTPDWLQPRTPSQGSVSGMTAESASDGASLSAQRETAKQTRKSSPRAKLDVNGLTPTYSVDGRVSVPGNGKPQRLLVARDTFEADVLARVVPERREAAFLSAEIENTSRAPVLPGSVRLFRDNSYVGSDRLNTLAPSDTTVLGFGVDQAVDVRHRVVRKDRETEGYGVVEDADRYTRRYVTRVRNGHEKPLDIQVLQRLPVSRDERVEVTTLDWTDRPDVRDHEDRPGVLMWARTIAPGESDQVRFGYTVTVPEELDLPGYPSR